MTGKTPIKVAIARIRGNLNVRFGKESVATHSIRASIRNASNLTLLA